MTSRPVIALSVVGAVMLAGMAVMHGSGYQYVASTMEASELPPFLKRVLPPLYLYPSALMLVLALVSLWALRLNAGRAPVLGVVAAIAAANSALGFVLGGLTPGAVMLLAACVFGVAAWLDSKRSSGIGT